MKRLMAEGTETRKLYQILKIKINPIGYCEVTFLQWVRFPWRRKWQPTPVSLPGKSHGQWSLVGCSPWGHKESGTTERLTLTYTQESIGQIPNW